MRRLIPAAAALAVATLVVGATPAQASTAPDVCPVLTTQGVQQLRAAAGNLFPAAAANLPDALLAEAARLKAGCTGNTPTLSPSDLQARLCAIATVEGLDALADRFGVSAASRAKITADRVGQVRAALHCDTSDSGSDSGKSNSSKSGSSKNSSDKHHHSDSSQTTPTSAPATAPAAITPAASSASVVNTVPVGGVNTGWGA